MRTVNQKRIELVVADWDDSGARKEWLGPEQQRRNDRECSRKKKQRLDWRRSCSPRSVCEPKISKFIAIEE